MGYNRSRRFVMFFVLRKFKYMRGYEHDMPTSEKCKNGFKTLEEAEKAKAVLEYLEFRPDMIDHIIVKSV